LQIFQAEFSLGESPRARTNNIYVAPLPAGSIQRVCHDTLLWLVSVSFGMSAHPQLRRLTKRRIALIQMEQSLNMLEAGDPVSALTLAGAAEEILGRAAVRKGTEPRVEYLADWDGSLFDWAGKPRPSKRQLVRLQNRVRNEMKHQDDGRNITVEADFVFEAESMLLRCMYNHFDAYGWYPQSKRLRRWFEKMTL
jgi:hypothetical protein